jgi:ubiquinone/menaquinone biosynthesis C-methylase UbiE
MKKNQYLHGYNKKEQKRLVDQAEFLEPYVYQGIDLDHNKNLLEVGCGVGAQTKILTRRFPKLKIDGIDLSNEQLAVAKNYLKKERRDQQVHLEQQDVLDLKLKKEDYEAAFICWFLEHVPDPLKALKNVKKHLKSGAKIYCSEVFNQTLFMEPYSPAYFKYWFEFNDYQWNIKGHPFIGAQLGHLLKQAGFVDINVEIRPFHFDSREPERRKAFVDYFFKILLSAEKSLLKAGRVTPELIQQMHHEVDVVKKSKDSVFFYAFVRATARVP